MPLPSLIEIVPLAAPVRAEITVPGSKSVTNRALILAALSDGLTTLNGALWSEDTQVMVECLEKLGFEVRVDPDANESCNRTITVRGLGGKIPRGGTVEKPLELFVGNAGTAARFLAAMVCLGPGVYRLHGVPRMHERPQAALFAALRELGYRVDSANDKLPAAIHGRDAFHRVPNSKQPENGGAVERVPARRCTVSVEESSQFASALLLSAEVGGWKIEVGGANDDELPYVEMTRQLISVFPKSGGIFEVEPDASSGSYVWAAHWLLNRSSHTSDSQIRVNLWPQSGWQIDEQFQKSIFGLLKLTYSISRKEDLGDSVLTAVVLAPLGCPQAAPDAELPGYKSTRFTDLGRLRVQECERVVALRTELTKCGAMVFETGDTLEVFPSELHGAEIETYNDHRMAMCFAILGLKVEGIKIKNPACVKKTFPNFFQKLAAAPPKGLGATILDGHTGQPLSQADLFAD